VTLSRLLEERRSDIVARFVAAVRRDDLPPDGLPRSALVDHIPLMLADLASELGGTSGAAVTDSAATGKKAAREHGRQRWNLGYDLRSVVEEYGILRHIIVECAEAEGVVLDNREFDAFGRYLNIGIAEATEEYIRHRDIELQEQQANLEFLAEAGELLSSSLDYHSTLVRLTRLLVPRVADWGVVHLDGLEIDDVPIVHVDPVKAGWLRQLYRDYPPSVGSYMDYRRAMSSGKPELMTTVAPDAEEGFAKDAGHLALLRKLGTCSWMIVPMRVQQHGLGALTLGYSESGRHYRDADLVLATDLARRASVAVDNARLYQLSQDERSRVEAATRAKDAFVAMVSHELRTPLNAILGWTRLARSGTLNEGKRDHAFEVIERNANAQNQLVNELLDISRAITGKITLTPAQVDLANIVDVALEDARLAAEAKRIELHSELERDQATMRGDADRLQQIVWNLLSNAIKFTPKGGAIHIDMRRVESDLELVVRDTGVGIAPDFLPHVFETFRQSDSSASRVHGGLGIGLSITKYLVSLHGGSIEARSPGLGQGATFVVRLPVSPLLSTTLGVAQVPAARREPTRFEPAGLHGLSILVVDDEPDARELIGYLLETCGANVQRADSAAAALELLGASAFELIISDIGMPREDGYSLIRSIRTLVAEANRNIPAIALTAFARNEDRERALTAGFNLHVAKPVEPSVLVQAVLDLTAHRRALPGG
jgi:signal transduction histidine kinase/ActR/RegA family two-component response regulator